MQTNFNLLPYDCDRALAKAWADSGRLIFIRKDRNGSTKVSLNGFPATNVRIAMQRIEAWYSQQRKGA